MCVCVCVAFHRITSTFLGGPCGVFFTSNVMVGGGGGRHDSRRIYSAAFLSQPFGYYISYFMHEIITMM